MRASSWAAGAVIASAVLLSSASSSAAEQGTVTFVVRDDRGNDLDAKITVDADPSPVPVGRQHALEAGIHDVHWSVATGAAGVQKLTVIEGQQGRIFQIIANPIIASPPPQSVAVTAPPDARSPSWPYILLGGGATLAVTSAVFQLVAMNEDSDAQHYFWTSTRDDLSPDIQAGIRESGRSHYDAAQTDQAIAITCGVLAVTAVSIAVTWLIVGK